MNEVKKLGELFEIKKGKKMEEVSGCNNDSVRYLQIDDLRNNDNIKYCRMVKGAILVSAEDILIAWDGANAGTLNYGLEGVIGSTLAALSPKRKLHIPYVGRFLQSKQKYLREKCTGATVPHINRRVFENIEIPLPPLETQKKIADTLDKAQSLIDKRKEQIAKLDEFLQSVFLDMFGDLDGDKKPISDMCEINPSKNETRCLPDDLEVSFVPMSNISEKGELLLTETRRLSEVVNGFTYFREGDVLFAKITPCMENGKGAVAKNLVNKIGFGSTEFHVLRPKEFINSQWLYRLTCLPSFRKQAEKSMTGSAGQKRVPKSFFDNYKVTIPPLDLQNKFARIVEKTEEQKALLQKSLVEMENLFNSIMQKAFRGELFTDR